MLTGSFGGRRQPLADLVRLAGGNVLEDLARNGAGEQAATALSYSADTAPPPTPDIVFRGDRGDGGSRSASDGGGGGGGGGRRVDAIEIFQDSAPSSSASSSSSCAASSSSSSSSSAAAATEPADLAADCEAPRAAAGRAGASGLAAWASGLRRLSYDAFLAGVMELTNA
jgi:hypothetical protein